MILIFRTGLFCFFALTFYSCRYDKISDNVIPKSPTEPFCSDSLQFAYGTNIKPILTTYCYTCHSSAVVQQNGSGLDLESYTSLYNYLSKVDYRGDGVFGSMFYHCILQSPSAMAMPVNASKLDSCSIIKIKHWLDAGAPNK